MNNNINNNGQTTQIKSALKSTSRSLVYRQNQHQHQQMENMNEQQRRVSFQSGRPPVVEGGARLAQLRAARKRAAQQKAQETSSNTNGQGNKLPFGTSWGNQTDQAGAQRRRHQNLTQHSSMSSSRMERLRKRKGTGRQVKPRPFVLVMKAPAESLGESSASGWRSEEKTNGDGGRGVGRDEFYW